MPPVMCSFCSKTQDQVAKLIAAPGVCICSECVDLCREILDEDVPSVASDEVASIKRRVAEQTEP